MPVSYIGESAVIPDHIRFMGGPGVAFSPVLDDSRKEWQVNTHFGIKFRFINPSRTAWNKFAIEVGPSVDIVPSLERYTDVFIDASFIYKASRLFGAGLFGGGGTRFTKFDKEDIRLNLSKYGAELQLYEDSVRLNGGIAVVDGDWDRAAGFFNLIIDMGRFASLVFF